MLLFAALPVIAGADAPLPPGWWPLPPGWWLLGLGLFLSLLWAAYFALRRFIRPARTVAGRMLPIRDRALAALDELESRRGLEAHEVAYRLNEILQAALPAEKQAELCSEQSWQNFWQELSLRYRPVMTAGDADIKRWLGLARGWIEQLPVEETRPEGVDGALRR